MTDHYAEAEQLLADAATAEGGSERERYSLAAAQVHATLAAIPPYPKTAEDLRGAEAEIARLNAVIDGMPYPSDFQNEDLVEKVARVIYEQTGGDMWDREIEPVRERYRKYARAVLAAIGGKQ